MLSNDSVFSLLQQYGHINQNDPYDDAILATGLASYQSFHEETLHDLKESYEGKHLNKVSISGELDPLTRLLFDQPRCGCNDFTPQGSGSWPKNCFGLGNQHHFVIQHDERNLPTWVPAKTILPVVFAAYLDVGLHMSFATRPNQYHTLMSYTSLRGPIGLAIVPSRPSCNSRIWARFERRYRPSDVFNMWAKLYAHELGHNMGLSHTRGGIMNPSILRGVFTTTAWRNDPSWATLRRFFS